MQSRRETTTTKRPMRLKNADSASKARKSTRHDPDPFQVEDQTVTGCNPSSSDLGFYVGVIQTIVHLFSILENVMDRCVLDVFFLQITL